MFEVLNTHRDNASFNTVYNVIFHIFYRYFASMISLISSFSNFLSSSRLVDAIILKKLLTKFEEVRKGADQAKYGNICICYRRMCVNEMNIKWENLLQKEFQKQNQYLFYALVLRSKASENWLVSTSSYW